MSTQNPNVNSNKNTECYKHVTEQDVHKHFLYEDYSTPIHSKITNRLLFRTKKSAKGDNDQKKEKTCFSRPFLPSILTRLCPAVGFVKHYTREAFCYDISAGFAVGLAAIPMGMSYALLAELHPVYGLYTDFLFPLIYMLFGGQAQIVVGTSAIEAMMTGEAITKLTGSEASITERANVGVQLAFFVGIILLLMRLLCFGHVSRFLAFPILSGFSTGSAIVIGTSQLKNITGISIPSNVITATNVWWYVFVHWRDIHIPSVLLTCYGLCLLLSLQKINRRWFQKYPLPHAFFLMLLTIPLAYIFTKKNWAHVNLVGTIPQGFPSFSLKNIQSGTTFSVIKQALTYSIFYFIIHITIAKTVAEQQHVMLDGNQEMLACGICSVVGSFFQCYPIATSLSRTCLATQSGARTPLFNILNAALVGFALSCATPLLYYLPKASLSSLILIAVSNMFFIQDGVYLLHMSLPDFLLWCVSCVVVVWRGAMEGITVAVTISILWLIKKNAFPELVELGNLPNTQIYRDIRRFPMAQRVSHCRILRFDASLHFANIDTLEHYIHTVCGNQMTCVEKFLKNQKSSQQSVSSLNTIIIDASKLEQQYIRLLFANWKGPMRDFLEKSEFYLSVKPEHCFLSLHDAVVWSQSLEDVQRISSVSPTKLNETHTTLKIISDNLSLTVKPLTPKASFSSNTCLSQSDSTVALSQPVTQVQFVTESTGSVTRDWPVVIHNAKV
ncbi:uncharacterized protein LOC128883872 isoform X2 [Hylaeus volcanicus]|uniref:uncharacterized protein LOC128883872 isoform X2 n=1 Tax=Hylaeus volcanicus TaxID=313075 RepID=UPI0023B79CF5|nr:uncharacterized protein LOC128883872 isoform X2 [Hylaeus volcanicus]